MCKVYGYCRVSTKTQSIERQERNIKAVYPDAIIFKEAFTGRKIEGRIEFLKLLKLVKAGDTIVFDSVSRMSRNAAEGYEQYERLFNQGVELVFLKEPQINTATYKLDAETELKIPGTGDAASDELIETVAGAIAKYRMRLAERQVRLAFEQAQKEVDDDRQRTKEGIATVKRHNELIDAGLEEGEKKQIGQKPGAKLTVKKAAAAKGGIKKYCQEFGGKFTDAETMEKIRISKPTYYKYKREIRAELEAEAAAVEAAIGAEF